MATYKLKNWSVNQQDPETIDTTVEFTFDNNQTLTLVMPHFRPASLAEMDASIKNRGRSEWNRIVAIAAAESAAQVLDNHIDIPYTFSQTL